MNLLVESGAEALLTDWMNRFDAAEPAPFDREKASAILRDLAGRLTGNYPFHAGVYAGQMLKPPHEIARAAYALAMLANPNNHALDGGPPTSVLEKELIRDLGRMTGMGSGVLGHLTSGGTVANLEALWVARCLHPEKGVGFSAAAHYTHSRMAGVLGMEAVSIPVNEYGVMDRAALEREAHRIGTLVVTLGTTGLGRVEPLHELLPFCRKRGIRVHVDAAYGGFFHLIKESGLIEPAPWQAAAEADSMVIDPHKHGLQPYGCGSVLFRDPSVGRFYKHDSPYTYFSSDELHLGEISLECSRAGAAAAAFWATLQLFPLTPDGLGSVLAACRRAALAFAGALENLPGYRLLTRPDLDIVTYFPWRPGYSAEQISDASAAVFHKGMNDPEQPLFVSLYKVDARLFQALQPGIPVGSGPVTVLRSVLMKPGHEASVDLLTRLLTRHAPAV